jgi:hypothetical protein
MSEGQGFTAEAANLLGDLGSPAYTPAVEDVSTAMDEEKKEPAKASVHEQPKPSAEESAASEPEAQEAKDATSELDSLRIQVKQLQVLLQQSMQQQQGQQAQLPQQPQAAQEVPFIDVASDDAFEAALSDPKAFNALLNNVAKAAVAQARESLFRELPGLINNQVTTYQTVQGKVAQFYANNRDLYDVGVASDYDRQQRAQLIATVANRVSAANPQWTIDQVFQESERLLREQLGIKKATPQAPPAPQQSRDKRAPAFAPAPKARAAQSAEPGVTDFQAQVKDLLGG